LRVAMAAYRPKPYSGKALFFHAAIPNPHWPDPLRVWKGVCRQLEVVEVPGGHSGLILPPNVGYVANALSRAKLGDWPSAEKEMPNALGDTCTSA
jgi:thioesterase domain-containing protein